METKIQCPWNSAMNNVSSMHTPRFIRNSAQALSFLLLPEHCLHCNSELYQGERHLCGRCRTQLAYTDHHRLYRHELLRIFDGRMPVEAAIALWYFDGEGPTRPLMHAIKYKGTLSAARHFGAELGSQVKASGFQAEAICPIPLHPSRQRRRGFNQAEVIAEGISASSGIPVWKGLKRVRKTKTQTKMDAWTRQGNVEQVFALKNSKEIIPRKIWLVDDVVTTGSTIESAASVIAPQAQIGVLTLAWAEKA